MHTDILLIDDLIRKTPEVIMEIKDEDWNTLICQFLADTFKVSVFPEPEQPESNRCGLGSFRGSQ